MSQEVLAEAIERIQRENLALRREIALIKQEKDQTNALPPD